MRFKIDENLPVEVAELLVKEGHNAITVNQQNMQGSDDDTFIEVCKKEKKTFITLDTDFSDIRCNQPKDYYGLILLRSYNQSKENSLKLIEKILPELKREKVI